ncbi:MAG: hypothetical protein CTY29_06355 [Methylobacter sp.]|nr:MAG: hypothetical protein CTY29_06355 [Methylobacter sp.]
MTNTPLQAQPGDPNAMQFDFGANWADYIAKNFSEERVRISQQHLLNFLKLTDLNGKTFLDVGCGSGLHSLAAWRAGAERVISFDLDGNSVTTTQKLHAFSGSPENWQILQGSVLDANFLATLPKADIVYSWGVLHHTGAMWQAVENAAGLLHDESVFYIALYSKDMYVDPPAEYWLTVKRRYNSANPLMKRWMVWCYAWDETIKRSLKKRKNPFKYILEYKKSRGMSYWHDVKDWLGGYPMDFAGNQETVAFAQQRLNLELLNIKAGEGNTEYLFAKPGAQNYWVQVMRGTVLVNLDKPFTALNGHAWHVDLSDWADSLGDPLKFMLYENGLPVGWPNAPRYAIEQWGKGRYRIEDNGLIFSATDNSDPNQAGKTYSFRTDFI